MMRALGPILAASAVGLLPFTVFSTFLVPIARDAHSDVAAVGALRGLGGLAALVVGAAAAPLLDRVPRLRAAALALTVLAIGGFVAASAEFAALVAFGVLAGAGLAILSPALTAAAADRFGDAPAAARAATLVTAMQSLTAMLAAPVVAGPALLWGWRGALVAISVLALVLAAVLACQRSAAPAPVAGRTGYLAAYRALAGLRPLWAVAFLRTAAFMGYLSYLAAFYDERFTLGPGRFALVWTLSGTAFFLANLMMGRVLARPEVPAVRWLRISLLIAAGAVIAIFATGILAVALISTALLGASHATAAACVVTLLVRAAPESRGAALGLNAAAMSSGTFAGAALGGIGLGLAGYPGAAAVFAVLTGAAVLVAGFAGKSPIRREPEPLP